MRRRTPAVLAAIGLVSMLATGCSSGNVFDLELGSCFDDTPELFSEDMAEISDVPIVACDGEHDNEVYASFDLASGDYPPDVEEQAGIGCYDRFEDYVGAAWETSRFEFSWMTPTPASWTQGDREVLCFLYDAELQRLTGSARDSGE